jgi:spore coat protein H
MREPIGLDCSVSRRSFIAAATFAGISGLRTSVFAQQNSPLPRKQSKTPDASDAFFINGEIPTMKIFIEDAELNKLRGNLRAYVKCRVLENDKTEYKDVGIKCKGAAGSFRGIDDRAAITLNFDKFIRQQNFHALDKIHLNNSVQDPTYMHEILCSDINLAAGVVCARATHARVWINNRDVGFYGLKEGFDKKMLKRHFANNDGNFYDGGFLQDIDANLERDEGTGPDDKADLKALVAACRDPDPAKRWSLVDTLLDVDNFLSFMALELMCCHWDGYCNNRNNYRVYFDPTSKKAYFFPHGMDQMFGDTNANVLHVPGALVSQTVMSNPEWRGRYRDRINDLMPMFNPPDKLHQRLDQIHARTRPVIAAWNAGAATDHDNQVKGLKERLVNRAKNLVQQNAVQEARPMKFDANDVAKIANWAPQKATDANLAEDSSVGAKSLMIAVGPSNRTVDSWRSKALLQAGTYKLQARARVAEVAAIAEPSGTGAGLRISGGQRTNKLEGTTDWVNLEHEFVVSAATQEVVLVAELRATKGKVWFDMASLQIAKVKK